MADLKDLLRPLADREMPDRWGKIRRRPVGPLPEHPRSSAGPMIVAAVVAGVALVAVAVMSPLGEGTGPTQGREPSPPAIIAPTSALPSADSVVDGRFITAVHLDDGGLTVEPPPDGMEPPIARSEVEDELWASPTFQGKDEGVLGWGLVTTTVTEPGMDRVTSVPAWVAFGWGGVTSCPMMTAAPAPVDLPSDGYVAVVIGALGHPQPFSYAARSSICGAPPAGPTVESATRVESIGWTQVGPVAEGNITITYTLERCATDRVISIAGSPSGSTLSVQVTNPDAPLPCPAPHDVTETVAVQSGATEIGHAPVGLVPQI